MATIYELTEQQQALLDALFWLDETDEDYDQQKAEIDRKLKSIAGSAENKLEFLSKIWLESRSVLEQRTEARKRAQKREKQAEKAEERLKNVIATIMSTFDIKRYDGEICSLSRSLSSGSVVFNEQFSIDLLDSRFVKLIPETKEPIKSVIQKALKDGEFVEGCELLKTDVVRIV